MNLLEEFKNDAQGLMLLKDWLGNKAIPVESDIAENRSLACCFGDHGKPCPMNVEPNWWERVKDKIANTIRQQLQIKKNLDLWTAKEGDLSMCKICGCCLKLKIHVPIEYVRQHTTTKQFNEFPAWCWIRKEIEERESL